MLSLKSTQFLDVASLAKSVKIVYFGLFFMQIFRPSYLWKKFTDPGFFPAKKCFLIRYSAATVLDSNPLALLTPEAR